MEDFEADPLQFWFLTRLVDVFSDAKTRGCSDVALKSTVCWLGYVLHKIISKCVRFSTKGLKQKVHLLVHSEHWISVSKFYFY